MKLNSINEAKLSTAQIRDVDKLIRNLQNLKQGDFKEVHQGYGRYHSIGRVISSLASELYTARPLETYTIPPIITRLIEKYPESVKTFQNHMVIIDPGTGQPKKFDYDDLRREKRNQEEAGDRGKSRVEVEIVSMLRDRQGYRTLQNYINYLKKFGFSGTNKLVIARLGLSLPSIILKVQSKNTMRAEYSKDNIHRESFNITTNGEVLKVEELINTINEVQLAAETIGIDIESAWVSRADGGVLYTLQKAEYSKDTLQTFDIDSEDIESVQDAYREIRKAMNPQEEDDPISNLSDRSIDRLDHTLANLD